MHRLQRQFDRQAEIEGKSEFDGKEAKPSILEHKTEGIKKIFSNDPIDSAKLTATEINPVTDERKIRSSAEYIVAKIKDRKTIVLAILLVILCGAVGWKIVQWNKSNPSSFTAESRGNLQISSLFSIKRKPKGAISDVSFSPDGKLILFLLSGDGKNDIYIKQPDAGEPIKITDGKWVNQTPIWSPDGQRIAFVSERDGKLGIWTVSYLGGLPVLKTLIELDPLTYQLKKWSNDGKRIYFETNEKLRTIELDSGQISDVRLPQIEIFGSFSISNDEKMITFVVIENQKEKVWTESLETGESKAITNTNKSTWSPVFFPDNQRIAYSSNQNGNYQIYVTDVNGSEPTQITFGDSNANIPTISPDGKRMVYVSESDEANIFSYDLKTSQESQYTSNTKMQLFPSVSPDNEKIVFQDTDYGAKVFASPLKIKILGKENEPNLINPNGGWAKWSPKGDAIAFLRLSGTDVNLWLIDVSNQKERQLSSHGILMGSISNSPYNLMFTPFNWSTDGRKIVFGSIEGELFNIWTINEDGSDLQMITNNQNTDLRYSSPIWSPDGNMIAFTYRTKTEPKKYQNGVSIIRNGQLANLFQNDFKVQILGWSKNGTEIFVTINNLDEISLISIPITSNTKPRTLAKLKGGYFEGTILSPDSQKIAFSARRNGIDNIFVYAINGKEWQLTSNLESTLYYSGLTWSPNGNSLFYSKQSGGMQISMISDSN